MAQLTQDATKKRLTREALLLDHPFLDESGIVSLRQQLKPTKEELATKPQPQKVGLCKRAVESHELVRTARVSVMSYWFDFLTIDQRSQ